MDTPGEASAPWYARDEHDREEAMFWEIVAGLPKSGSRNVTNEAESRRWDRLEADIARTRAKHPGGEIVKDNGA
jgi:tRNA A22 N-methylase